MASWVSEYGTLWSLDSSNSLPALCSARVEVEFGEVKPADLPALVQAMDLPSIESVRQRLSEKRRCFCLRVIDDQGAEAHQAIAAYGWVTQGREHVGELERYFHLRDDEAYIWDCRTLPAWRGQRLYSTLLSHMIYRLHADQVARIWIGASRQNVPSINGFENAGFEPVIDCTYYRFYRLTFMWFKKVSSSPQLISAAYRIMLNNHEKRLGPLAVGLTGGTNPGN